MNICTSISFFSLIFSSIFSSQYQTSFPYLSGLTWVHFSDWKLLGKDYSGNETSFDPELVKLGDTIYVDSLCLDLFIEEYLPKIQEKVILITSNYGYGSDQSLPGKYESLLESDKIAAWFVQNIDRAPTSKLIPIPIGLANKNWAHGNTTLLDSIIPTALIKKKRKNFIYINITPRPERVNCINYFKSLGLKFENQKSYPLYLQDLSKSVFVVSPKGNGLDCHRTWEALLLGCFPIVESSSLDPLYEDLPILIINNWEEVTTALLKKTYAKFSNKEWSREKLYAPYWFQKVYNIKKGLQS